MGYSLRERGSRPEQPVQSGVQPEVRGFYHDKPASVWYCVGISIFAILLTEGYIEECIMATDPAAIQTSIFQTTIAPWLSVRDSARAIDFYKSAFGAIELFRLEGDGVVARLSVEGAEFWLSDESPEHFNFSPQTLGGSTVRIILTVPDPDAVFARALAAGASLVYAVVEEHGWRVGRVVDPFGHHWEIGRQIE
jgi:PhnB protein